MASSSKTPILIAGGVLAGAVVAAGALTAGNALADNSTPTPSSSASESPGTARPGGGPDGFRHGRGGLGELGRALHGEFVVQDSDGSGTTTMLTQRGSVTARSGSTVTVKSTDGFSLTWTLNGDTRIRTGFDQGKASDLAVGDDVVAFGPKTVSGATASVIAEPPTAAQRAEGGWRGHGHGGQLKDRSGRGGATPSPSTTPGSTSSSTT